MRTVVGLDGRPSPPLAAENTTGASPSSWPSSANDSAGESLAGNDSSDGLVDAGLPAAASASGSSV